MKNYLMQYFDKKNARTCKEPESADQKFLPSLLPDMELMNVRNIRYHRENIMR